MCNLDTEGTKFGCGHYVTTRKVNKRDCRDRYCTHSSRHTQPCDCSHCERYLGPDCSETITHTTTDLCKNCVGYYGTGAHPWR
ncbi:hypothetical protein BDV98DRAFT_319951 [Pterulicium gracile]|uniref:Uncharacterized protein n=1 Tax=Pterulicium gracile TaxID=1884261 RepID=A0A5C3QT42_9AGAR|nr:hypothetical protein BDV98DRAFT_319951 [Pterula gracilis]